MARFKTILKIALPLPLPELYEYGMPESLRADQCEIGTRVLVPFGPRELVGIIISHQQHSEYDESRVKPILQTLEDDPALTAELIALCTWAASYYHHAQGEILAAALPLRYRKNEARIDLRQRAWRHTTEGKGLPIDALKRSQKQQSLHQLLLEKSSISEKALAEKGISKAVCKALADKGLIEETLIEIPKAPSDSPVIASQAPQLNHQQKLAVDIIRFHRFQTYLLEGVTGSGKTEVYMQLIARCLNSGSQALVLIPEIGLSPQTLSRFHSRFNVEIAELHSRVSEVERAASWEKARSGIAQIIIGTRLSALTPVKQLGIIIVDEEHDASYKQQDGFRYSARDLCIYRASQLKIPIVLGTATPSLESLHNALTGRYQHLKLDSRANEIQAPKMEISDLRKQSLTSGGLGQVAIDEIAKTLNAGKQAMVFLNRRGYAPLLYCQHCGWHAHCDACEMNLTLHQSPPRLHCHHCDARKAVPKQCPSCGNAQLFHRGVGTEQVVESLEGLFNSALVLRIDRDTTRNKHDFSDLLDRVHEGKPCILVGTQMLAKGHHLKNLQLVVILDADQGLMNPDFRSLERLGQLVTQVAGRAGREQSQGLVLLQSLQPEHPMLLKLTQEGYASFAEELLDLRRTASLPPFCYSALFRAESKRPENALELLGLVKRLLKRALVENKSANKNHALRILGPFPSAIEKIQERFRFQLQVYSPSRSELHQCIHLSMKHIYNNALAKRTRWSIDIDPYDTI